MEDGVREKTEREGGAKKMARCDVVKISGFVVLVFVLGTNRANAAELKVAAEATSPKVGTYQTSFTDILATQNGSMVNYGESTLSVSPYVSVQVLRYYGPCYVKNYGVYKGTKGQYFVQTNLYATASFTGGCAWTDDDLTLQVTVTRGLDTGTTLVRIRPH